MSKKIEDLINFEPEDWQNYQKYSLIRGCQLYFFISKYFCKDNKIEYSYVRDLIRYDKRLKDKLYVYLGTFEDSLKSLIYEKTNFINSEFKLSIKIDGSSFKKINSKERYDLSKLIKILEKEGIKDKSEIKDLEKIKEFRNKVLHYNFLLLKYNDKDEVESRSEWLKENILNLKNYLPKDYQENFVKSINNCKKDLNLDKSCIMGVL